MTIMGYPQYEVKRGRIVFKGQDITHLPIDERAKLGIGMSYQRPPTVNGLKTKQMLEICGKNGVDALALARSLNFKEFLERDVNAGFSGGEIKRSELLQLIAQDPDLLLFDEPESGVDIENMALIGKTIARVLQKAPGEDKTKAIAEQWRKRTKMGLIITHTGYVLDYVPADKGQVLYQGVLSCVGNPREIFDCITTSGYEECVRCSTRQN
jgi:Fe-S cluster assembly ATP-binding protein